MIDRAKFRQLVESPEILVMPGAYDALSAKLVEASGFPVAYMTGYGQSASKLGAPDVGLMTMSEMAERAKDMCYRSCLTLSEELGLQSVSFCCISTGEFRFPPEEAAHIAVRTVREYERAGAAAIQIEDQRMPKKCGHMLGRQVVDAQEMVNKIQAACAARHDPDFLIIARTDARTNHGVEEAIRRATLYEQAGADIIFVESLESAEEMRLVNQAVTKPTIANMVEGGRSPYLSAGELQALGYRLVVFPVLTLYAAMASVLDVLSELKDKGTVDLTSGKMVNFTQFNELIGLPQERRLEENDFSVLPR